MGGGQVRRVLPPLTGSEARGLARRTGARRIDLEGGALAPGFTDAHVHVYLLAEDLAGVDVSGLPRPALLARLRAATGEVRGPVVAKNLDPVQLGRRPLAREELDALSPGAPMLVLTRDLHAMYANSRALARVGLDGRPSPRPGLELRGGRATGYLREDAAFQLREAFPAARGARLRRSLREALRLFHAQGVVAVHDFDGLRTWDGAARDPGLPPMRYLCHALRGDLAEVRRRRLRTGSGRGYRRFGGLKLFLDGSLGSRSAWTTDGGGMALLRGRELDALVDEAVERGMTLALHAIGDAAMREALRALRRRARDLPAPARIEHAELFPPSPAPRLPRGHVRASLQPLHREDDLPLLEGPYRFAAARAFRYRTFLERGHPVLLGTDAPVYRPAMLATLRAACAPGLPPAGRLTPEEALRAVTLEPARAALEGERRGVLAPGRAADLVWTDRPLLGPGGPPEGTRVRGTWLAGRRVYAAP